MLSTLPFRPLMPLPQKATSKQATEQFHSTLSPNKKEGHVAAFNKIKSCIDDGGTSDTDRAKANKQIAYMYLYGIGVEKDSAQALHYFTEANKLGHMDMHALELEAEGGNVDAQYIVGMMYKKSAQQYYEPDCEPDLKKARYFFRLAHGQEHAAARYELGLIYYSDSGNGKDKNIEDMAISFIQMSAKQDHVPAMISVGWIFYTGSGDGFPQDKAKGPFFRLPKRPKEYVPALKKEYVPALNTPSLEKLRTECVRCDRIQKDYSAAATYFQKAADLGNADAQYIIARMFCNGEGVEKDEGKARNYFKLAAEQGHANAQYSLGFMLKNAKLIEQAIPYLKLSAEQGNAHANKQLGEIYTEMAIECLSKHEIDSQKEYAAIAFDYYKKAADKGHAVAQRNLGDMYMQGLGVKESDVQAAKYYKLAADRGDPVAQRNLGDMYMQGLGVKESDVQAAKYYKLAANQGDARAQYNYGIMLDYEWGGVTKNTKRADRYYKLAADQGNVHAQYAIGYFGRSENSSKYLELAAKQGQEDARAWVKYENKHPLASFMAYIDPENYVYTNPTKLTTAPQLIFK